MGTQSLKITLYIILTCSGIYNILRGKSKLKNNMHNIINFLLRII